MGHKARALRQQMLADKQWEADYGEKIEVLHEIDRKANMDEITGEQRLQMIEQLFPGFLNLRTQLAAKRKNSKKGEKQGNIRLYRDGREDAIFT